MKLSQVNEIFERIKLDVPSYHREAVFKSLRKCNTAFLDFLEKRVK